jgi:hypothetical protein
MEVPHIARAGRLGKKPVQLKGQRIRSNGASTGKTVHAHSLVAVVAGRSLGHHHDLHLESWEPRLGAGQILHVPFDAPDVWWIALIHVQNTHCSSGRLHLRGLIAYSDREQFLHFG